MEPQAELAEPQVQLQVEPQAEPQAESVVGQKRGNPAQPTMQPGPKRVKTDHSHSESCHGKDRGDSEGGSFKFLGEQREMQHTIENPTQMDTTLALYDWAVGVDENGRGNIQPQKSLFEKKGVGVYRREVFYIGARSVKHNLPECAGVNDSSKMHQLLDIGRSGFLKVRALSCHWCKNCIALKPGLCENRERCGPMLVKEVKLKKSGRADVPLLRSTPALRGQALAQTLKVDDFICIELDDVQVPWVIAQVTSCCWLAGVKGA